jgi:hypothetical protein
MKDPTTGRRAYGRTRWRRFGILLAPAFTAVAVMMYLVATGVIAVGFAISGIPFTLSASNLSGDNFVQYATVDPTTNAAASGLVEAASPGSTKVASGAAYDAVTVTVLSSATITGLDQVICAPIPAPLNGLGSLKVELSSGGTVTASQLVVDAPLLLASGTATFTNMNIGQDAGQALGGTNNGAFSQAASHVSIDGLRQVAIGTSAGTFSLAGLKLNATFVGSC